MIILSLDLSLTATGAAILERDDSLDALCRVLHHRTIKTPSRAKGETTPFWNRRRYGHFAGYIDDLVGAYQPSVVVTEVTEHAYQVVRTGGGRQKKSSKGIEYRAGYGLGRSMGWLDSALIVAGAGTDMRFWPYAEIAASEVKLRVAGSASASKEAVRDGLKTYFKIDATGWPEAESDAVAVGVAWLRNLQHEEQMASLVPPEKLTSAAIKKAVRGARAQRV